MDERRKKRDEALNEISDQFLGSNAAIIGNRAQLYDFRNERLDARTRLSFTIRHSRIMHLAASSQYKPLLSNIQEEKKILWFTLQDAMHTNLDKKFTEVLDSAKELKIIDVQDQKLYPLFTTLVDPLKKCGKVLRDWMSDIPDYQTRKIRSLNSILVLNVINNIKPTINEIPYLEFGIQKFSYVKLLNDLETFGIITKTSSNQYLPYLSLEIYGVTVENKMNNLLEDINNRTLFEWIRKMPGISLKKIQNIAYRDLQLSGKIALSTIIDSFQKAGFIEIHFNNKYEYGYIVPVWLRNKVLEIYPTRIESDMVVNAINACGELWNSLTDLNQHGKIVDNTLETLDLLLKDEGIALKQLPDLQPSLSKVLISFHYDGILDYNDDEKKFHIEDKNKDILKVILNILKIARTEKIWTEFITSSPKINEMKKDFNPTKAEIHDRIINIYKKDDLKKFNEYI